MTEFVDIVNKIVAFAVGSPVVAIVVQMLKKGLNLKGIAIRWVAIGIGIVASILFALTVTIPVGTELWYHWVTYIGAGIIAGITSGKMWDLAKDAATHVNER
jgi:hypothetical protein